MEKMEIKTISNMEDYNIVHKIPPIPQAIKEAVNRNTLVVFIGAGVSRIIGCMGWDQLAKNLISVCFNTKNKIQTSTLINFKEKETLTQCNDHKKIITICHHILKENDLEELFYKEFDKALEANKEKEKEFDIYKELFGLRGIFISTNADEHFDKKFTSKNRISNIDDFNISEINRSKLYKIHGTQKKRESLIFTIPAYIHQYNQLKFKKFLEEIFGSERINTKYTVLFVGYGMSEFELLDYLITKFDSTKKNKTTYREIKHYILLPFYKGEENILNFEQSYYNLMGVQVLGYEKDEKGYNQLYEVIKKWNEEINQTSTYTLESFQEIENIISSL